jgi:cardiolipin synthase
VPTWVGILLIAREVYMAIVTLFLVVRGAGTLEVRWLGKLATFLVYSSIGWFYFAAIPFLEVILLPAAWIAALAGLALYWLTAFQYTGDALATIRELESATNLQESG